MWKDVKENDFKLNLKEGESLIDIDQDKLTVEEDLSTCNTRKIRDKRIEDTQQEYLFLQHHVALFPILMNFMDVSQ